MADSDAPNDEDAPEGAGFDGEFVEPSVRRSTYTPPTTGAHPTYSLDDVPVSEDTTPPPVFNPPPFDDDDGVYAAENTGPTVYSLDDPVTGQPPFSDPDTTSSPFAPPPFEPSTFSAESAATWAPPVFDPPPVAPPQPTDEQLAAAPPPWFDWTAPPVAPPGGSVQPRADEPEFETADPAETEVVEPESEPAPIDLSAFAPPPPPWGSPAPSSFGDQPADTSTDAGFPSAEEQARLLAQHAGPTSRPWIPERQSLTDDELAAGLSAELQGSANQPGAVLDAMEQLERQLWLRAEEAREYQEWEQSMLSIGTPEALAAVEEVRPQFEDVVASTTSIPIQYPDAPPAAAIDVEPAEALDDEAAPTEESLPVGEPAVASEPAPVLPAVDPFDFSSFPPPFVPEAAPAEQSVAAPAPEPAPEPEPAASVDPFDFTAALGARAAEPIEIAPEAAPEPEAEPEQAAFDPFDFTSLPVVPPALIEPPEPAPPTGAPWAVQLPVVNELPDERTIDPFADLPEPVAPGPESSAPLFVEPVLPAAPFSFDDLLASEPEEPTEPEVQAPAVDPFDMTALPLFAPVAVPDAVVEPEVPVAAPSRRAAIAEEEPVELVEVVDERPGGAVRLLWRWFSTSASVIAVATGAFLFSLGMSLRQAVIATIIGLVLSLIPVAIGTISGRRTGQPTLVASRATFGFYGNILPSLLSLVTRVFWGAALLWVLGASVASLLVGARLTGGLASDQLVIATMGAGFVVALLIAFFGARVIAVFQLVVSVLALVLVAGVVALTWRYVSFSTALSVQDGSVALLVTGGVLVFSVVGLLWAMSAGDLARDRRPCPSRGAAALFASIGIVLPLVVLISYGALLAASNPVVAKGLLSDPVDTIGRMLPLWYPVPLIAAVALSLLSAIVVLISSGSSALVGAGLRLSPTLGALLVAILVFAFGWLLSTLGADPGVLIRDLATTLGVPVAAFVGVFAADTVIRRRPISTASLLTPGGVYPAARWVNLVALVIASAVGWGLTASALAGLDWQGYIFRLGGITGNVASSNIGVVVALVLGLLIALGFGVREVRRQEALEP